MTKNRFEELVKNRAHDRVQTKITKFRKVCLTEAEELLGLYSGAFKGYGNSIPANGKELFVILASDNMNKGWPRDLWDREEGKVTEELFSIMDEMQKALLSSPPKDGDYKPKEAEKEEVK